MSQSIPLDESNSIRGEGSGGLQHSVECEVETTRSHKRRVTRQSLRLMERSQKRQRRAECGAPHSTPVAQHSQSKTQPSSTKLEPNKPRGSISVEVPYWPIIDWQRQTCTHMCSSLSVCKITNELSDLKKEDRSTSNELTNRPNLSPQG